MTDERKKVKVPKLVRDNMVPIWERYQDRVKFRYLTEPEFKAALLDKIVEEALEMHEDPCVEEFADLLEVTISAAAKHGFTLQQVQQAMSKKRAERGGFTRGLYLEEFEWGPLRPNKKEPDKP